jgi:hypothetical protein
MLVLDTDLLTLVQQKSGAEYARLDARLEVASGNLSDFRRVPGLRVEDRTAH